MTGLQKTISVLGFCQIFLISLPVYALTVDDYISDGTQMETTHLDLDNVVGDISAKNALAEGELICTKNNEECMINHPGEGESANVGGQAIVIPPTDEPVPAAVIEPAPAVAEIAPTPAPAPIVVVVHQYAPAPQQEAAAAPAAEETIPQVTPEQVVQEVAQVVAPLTQAILDPELSSFGLADIFKGQAKPADGQGSEVWIVYWSLIGAFSYAVTLWLLRAVETTKAKVEVEDHIKRHRRAGLLQKRK